jgi:hypothetical protein
MNDKELKSFFPVHIDVCQEREVTDYDKPVKDGQERPKKKITDCPTIYIRGVDGLDALPVDGYVLMKIHRSALTMKDRTPGVSGSGGLSYPRGDEEEGKSMDAELEIHEICLPASESKDDSEDGGDGDGFGDAMDKTAEKMGLKKKPKKEMASPDGDGGEDGEEY